MYRAWMAAAVMTLYMPAVCAGTVVRLYLAASDNDAEIRSIRYARDAALEVQPLARAELLPQIAGAYSRDRNFDDTRYSWAPNGEADMPGNATYWADSWQLTFRQTLFDWAAFERMNAAELEATLAETKSQASEQGLILRVVQAYFDVLSARNSMMLSDSGRIKLEALYQKASTARIVGEVEGRELARAESALMAANAQLSHDRQSLSDAEFKLAQLTAIDSPPANPAPVDGGEVGPPLNAKLAGDLGKWIDAAKAQNYDIAAARIDVSIAERALNIAWAENYPTVALVGQYSNADQDGGVLGFDRVGVDQTRRAIGLRISMPIISGGAASAKIRQARFLLDEKRASLEHVQRRVEGETRADFGAVGTGLGQIRALQKAFVVAGADLLEGRTAQSVGDDTFVDTLASQEALAFSRQRLQQAIYDYLLRTLKLRADVGNLTANDLFWIDKVLGGGTAN